MVEFTALLRRDPERASPATRKRGLTAFILQPSRAFFTQGRAGVPRFVPCAVISASFAKSGQRCGFF